MVTAPTTLSYVLYTLSSPLFFSLSNKTTYRRRFFLVFSFYLFDRMIVCQPFSFTSTNAVGYSWIISIYVM